MRRNATTDDMVEVDVEAKPAATPKQLARILEAAREQKNQENKVAKLEKQLADAKRDLQVLMTKTVPAVMMEASLDEAPLGKGWSVAIENIVTASIPAPDSDRAENAAERNRVGIDYMRKTAPDLIDNVITIHFPVGEEKFFNKVIGDIKKRKKELDYSTKSVIHSGRLSAWVRRQDEAGKAVDEVALNVHRIRRSKLVAPKVKGVKRDRV